MYAFMEDIKEHRRKQRLHSRHLGPFHRSETRTSAGGHFVKKYITNHV